MSNIDMLAEAHAEAVNDAIEAARERFVISGDLAVSEGQKQAMREVQSLVVGLAARIELVVPNGRDKSLALTALEDVLMRANRGIVTTPPNAYDN